MTDNIKIKGLIFNFMSINNRLMTYIKIYVFDNIDYYSILNCVMNNYKICM